MGTIISPGPCITNWGSRISVGVSVKVGIGVSDGARVEVSVGEGLRVKVDEGVGEGNGLGVHIDVAGGVGGEIKLNPPQLIKDKVSADMPIRNLFVIAGYLAQSRGQPRRSACNKAVSFYRETFSVFYEIASSGRTPSSQ